MRSIFLTLPLALTLGCSTEVSSRSAGTAGPGGFAMPPGSSSTPPTGTSTGGPAPNTPPVPVVQDPFGGFNCDATVAVPPSRRLWRLNPLQYENTIATLFSGRRAGTGSIPTLPADLTVPLMPSAGRYSTESGLTTITDSEFRASISSTETTASKLVEALSGSSCWATDRSGPGMPACAQALIQERGAILFRRPLSDDEIAHYAGFVIQDEAMLGPDGALALAFRSMLLAPQFLFQPEIGREIMPGTSRLTAFEVASSLAYAVAAGPPDVELWSAASANELGSIEQIKSQAARLLRSGVAPGATHFVTEYFRLRDLLGVPKTADLIESGSPAACHYNKRSLVAQAEALVGDVYASNAESGFINALFTSSTAFFDCSSAALFGLSGGPADAAPPAKAQSPVGQRAGFLTHPAWLGALAGRDETLPVRRGLFMNEQILCREVPAVPIEGVPSLGDTTELTMRERLAVHAEPNASCRPCHELLDPSGLAFEIYDTVGAYRTVDKGKTLDASGALVGVEDASVAFKDAVELSTLIAPTKRIEECVMRNGFRYFTGRTENAFDGCSLKKAQDAYSVGGSYIEFISALVASDSFLNRSH